MEYRRYFRRSFRQFGRLAALGPLVRGPLVGGAFALWLIALASPTPGSAAVAILLNRASRDMSYAGADHVRRELPAGDVAPLAFDGDGLIEFRSGSGALTRRIEPNRMYIFVDALGGVELRRLGLSTDIAEEVVLPAGGPANDRNDATPVAKTPIPADTARRVVIPVKILVDEDEPATRAVWEKRLRRRVAAASVILKKHCFVELDVVAVDEWNSQNGVTDFDQSLSEFEREVSPGPARLAIGFTSQHKLTRGLTHLGGTRALLHSHLLMREWSQVASEPERLELLLHELGHFLGAAHRAEPQSVMRGLLADRKSLAAAFHIRFDPLNALAMNLVADELRRNVNLRPADLSLPTQFELCKLYAEIHRSLPADPAAAQMENVLERAGLMPRLAAAQWVLRAVMIAAEENSKLPLPGAAAGGQPARREGDALAEFYIARAALAARRAPPKLAAAGFTIGLAIALDRSTLLRGHPLVGPMCERVEPPRARALRLELLGEPTAFGRADLPQHFFVSAGLASLIGPLAAESIGLWKEQRDAKTPTGFSLVDYETDLAGIALAEALREGSRSLPDVDHPFAWRDYLPMTDNLPEGLGAEQFAQRYGSVLDPRFLRERQRLRQAIDQLPIYATARSTKSKSGER